MTPRWYASRPAPALPPERLLAVRWEAPGRCFFDAPGGLTVAGLGESAVIEASGPDRIEALGEQADSLLDSLQPVHETSSRPVLVGGFSFANRTSTAGPWTGWRPGRLVLPEVSFVLRGDEGTVFAVAPAGLDEEAATAWLDARLTLALEGLATAPAPQGPAESVGAPTAAAWGFVAGLANDGPTRSMPLAASSGGLGMVEVAPSTEPHYTADPYEDLVADGLAAIGGARLRKVTLARSRRFGRVRGTTPSVVLDAFARRYPDCFRFWVEPAGRSAFAGASPERLVARRGRSVRADALAGTVGRANEPAADANLGALLLANNKERREHEAVVGFLRERLGRFADGDAVEAASTPGLLKLANVQHLHTPFTLRMPEGGPGILSLAAQVHPTPAVAGVPADEATAWIDEHEELDRGWYSGGVGVVEHGGDGELCVAIRSGLFEDEALWLFAGAGIVSGSDPSREAREVEQKMRALRDLLVEG
ncbi:MAG: isochorismate synthase [Deltaproteobacteria bacterium]|nr:isochorismate synthase [Deltaproteobacteria bacterium]